MFIKVNPLFTLNNLSKTKIILNANLFLFDKVRSGLLLLSTYNIILYFFRFVKGKLKENQDFLNFQFQLFLNLRTKLITS